MILWLCAGAQGAAAAWLAVREFRRSVAVLVVVGAMLVLGTAGGQEPPAPAAKGAFKCGKCLDVPAAAGWARCQLCGEREAQRPPSPGDLCCVKCAERHGLCAGCGAETGGKKLEASPEKTVAKLRMLTALAAEAQVLIPKLGSDDWEVREAARKRLLAVGAPAERALIAASRSGDAEISSSAKDLLAVIQVTERRAWAANVAAAVLEVLNRKDLERLSERSQERIAVGATSIPAREFWERYLNPVKEDRELLATDFIFMSRPSPEAIGALPANDNVLALVSSAMDGCKFRDGETLVLYRAIRRRRDEQADAGMVPAPRRGRELAVVVILGIDGKVRAWEETPFRGL